MVGIGDKNIFRIKYTVEEEKSVNDVEYIGIIR